MNRWHAFTQLVLARIREFIREPEALFWVYGFPLALAIGLGLAFRSTTVEPPIVDVQNEADPAWAKEIAAKLTAAKVKVEEHADADCRLRFRRGKTAMFLIPRDREIEYVFDPTHAEGVQARHWVDAVLLRATDASSAVPAKDQELREPGTRYIDFLLPGLVGMNLMGGGMFGVGFVLVEMRVRKLFKRLMATPMHRGDFLLSMLASRLLFLIPEMFSLLIVARWLFGVPVLGSWLTLMLVVLLGALAFAGIGLLVASRTEKTETVSGLINLIVLPMWVLSGVFFSPSRFPDAMQPFIQALPLTQLNHALREVMLHGAGIVDIAGSLAILVAYASVTFVLALRRFKWA